jgi:Uncharacterized protein involved in methicillin resistance
VAGSQHFLVEHDFPRPEIETLWRRFLQRVELPSHYNTPEFFLEPYWEGSKPFAVLAFADSNIVGVLTGLNNGKNVVCGLPSRPQICLDKAIDPALVSHILVEGLLSEAQDTGLITLYSWESTPLPGFRERGFQVKQADEVVLLDLSAGPDALFEGFAKNRRRDVRLAIRNGIEVSEESSDQDLQEYWEVYSAWRRTERKKIEHNRSFSAVQKVHQMRGNHRRFLARYQGKVVAAAGFRFCPGGLIEYANNCSLDEYMKLLPNDLLVWRSIEWAYRQGFKHYSFGGAHQFLRKWGGTVVSTHRYRLDRTFFRRHDLRESGMRIGRELVKRMPQSLQAAVRKTLGKK